MIEVCVSAIGVTVDGHAGYEEEGKDIICAAVSALTLNLIKSLESLTSDTIKYQIRKGHINIVFKNLSEKGKLLIDSFFIGISGIIEAYGDKYVRLL